jgi:hypothetical protein
MTAIFDEYRRFAESKSRFLDQQFIELFEVTSELRKAHYRWEEQKDEAIVCKRYHITSVFACI